LPPILTPPGDLPHGVSQLVGQNRTQPRRPLLGSRPAELVPVPVRLHQRLLDHVRGIEQAAELWVELEPGQQAQV
jgi:hypothetical protein